MLQHPRAGEHSILGDVADNKQGNAFDLDQVGQNGRAIPHLANTARGRCDLSAVQNLDGVNDHDLRRHFLDITHNRIEIDLVDDI